MDRIVGRLVSLILFAFFVSKLVDSVRKLNDDKIGMAISVKRYTSKKIDAVFIHQCWKSKRPHPQKLC